MAKAATAGDAMPMLIGTTTTGPGDLTRNGYDRLLDERLHQELALLIARRREAGGRAGDGAALLGRRITLLQAWLAQPHR